MKTRFKQELLKAAHSFFKNNLKKSQETIVKIPIQGLEKSELWQLGKFHQLFFLGQLLGLPTLRSILKMHGIESNTLQIKYSTLCKQLTHNKLKQIYEFLFQQNFRAKITELGLLSDSEWSKANVTAILDASVFMQFLQSLQSLDADTADFWGKWYSGQTKTAVYGFKVLTFGVTIQDVFYPLFLEFVKKNDPESSEIALSCRLLERFDQMWREMRLKQVELPEKVHLSCDNGYSHKDLIPVCIKCNLILICVPKKNHLFKIGDTKKKLSKWIESEFLDQEAAFLAAQQNNKEAKPEKKPFILRIKAYYNALKEEVILLIFRLNGSKKGTIIYCLEKQSPSIFGKTMRHHWFARTQIEQFFKLLKHVLKIKEPKSQTKFEMTCKLYRFFIMAIEAQRFRDFMRKQCPFLQKCGFKQMVRYITFHFNKIKMLEELLKTDFSVQKDLSY
jgi:hypothetical protein